MASSTIWTDLAIAGLRRSVPVERLASARAAIDLKLAFGAAAMRRHLAFEREIYVFTQFAGNTLRIVIEKTETTTVWHVGIQPNGSSTG
jgi:hypothetical protein